MNVQHQRLLDSIRNEGLGGRTVRLLWATKRDPRQKRADTFCYATPVGTFIVVDYGDDGIGVWNEVACNTITGTVEAVLGLEEGTASLVA